MALRTHRTVSIRVAGGFLPKARHRPALFFLGAWIMAATPAMAQTLFVDGMATGANNGTSWTDAYTNLNEAVLAAADGNTVLVASGTYVLSGQLTITNAILLQSDSGAWNTVIDANLASRALYVDAPGAEVDGFTLVNGQTFVFEDYGGGVLISNGLVKNCVIMHNVSYDTGGGAAVAAGGTLRNCLVVSNDTHYGGGVYVDGGTVQSCTIVSNSAPTSGGGGIVAETNSTIWNTIIYDNTGGMLGTNFTSYGAEFNYCCSDIDPGGISNLTVDPLFVNPGGGDYRLQVGSPCADSGTNEEWMAAVTDLDGAVRVSNITVDRGCFESAGGGGPPFSFRVYGFPDAAVTGQYGSVTVEAWDGMSRVTGYTGTVHFTSSDASAELPPDYTFTPGDGGIHAFTNAVMFFNCGVHNAIYVEDLADPWVNGRQEGILVANGFSSDPATQLEVWGFGDHVVTGSWHTVRLAALDMYYQLVTNYTGTVLFSCSDSNAVMPGGWSYGFSLLDGGFKALTNGLQLNSIGEHWFQATEMGNTNLYQRFWNITIEGTGLSTNVTHFAIEGLDHWVTTNDTWAFGIQARNEFEQVVTGFVGQVDFFCSDPAAEIPANCTIGPGDYGEYWFTNGVVRFATPGDGHWFEGRWQSDTNVKGGIYDIHVDTGGMGGGCGGFDVEFERSPVLAGEALTLTVRAMDSGGNVETGYTGSITLTCSDPGASVPNFYSFVGTDYGVKVFSNAVIFATGGDQGIEVQDQGDPGKTGGEDVTVLLGGATNTTHFYVELEPYPFFSNQWHDVIMVAMGDGDLVNTNHTAPVQFVTSDGAASVAVNPFGAFVNGMAFISSQVCMRTPGMQTFRVQEQGNTNIGSGRAAVVLGGGTYYYVDGVSGSDSNNGLSSATAWRTISRAVSQPAGPGDVVLIASAFYSESVTFTTSGQPDKYITLFGDEERRFFGGSVAGAVEVSSGSLPAFDTANNSWIALCGVWSGDMALSSTGIVVRGGSNVLLSDLEIQNRLNGISVVNTPGVVIDDCEVGGCASSGIKVDGASHNVVVTNTEVVSCLLGLEVTGGVSNAVIADCELIDNTSGGLLLGGSEGRVRGNVVCVNKGFGIVVSSVGARADIGNNVVAGNTSDGIGFVSADAGSTVINNTVVNNNQGIILTSTVGATLKNNIVAYNLSAGIILDAASTNGSVGAYNCAYGNNGNDWADAATPGPGSFSMDPLFDSTDAETGLHLQSTAGHPSLSGWIFDGATSPCLDAGDPGDPFDHEPMPNGGRVDMGAYGNHKYASKSPGQNFSLTVTSDYGTVDPMAGSNDYPAGTPILCTVLDSPVDFGTWREVCVGWSGSGSVPVSGATTNVMITLTNHSAIAWTWQAWYLADAIAASADQGAVSGLTNGGWYLDGSVANVTATPSNGYAFVEWTGDVASSNPVLALSMTQAYYVVANFTPITYDITASAGANGSISPSGTVWTAHGNSEWFWFGPDPNYHVTNVIVDSVSQGPLTDYTFSNVTNGGHTISVTFALDEYNLEVVTPVGTGSPAAGTNTYAYNTPLTASILSSPVVDGTTQYVCNGWTGFGDVPASGVGLSTLPFNLTMDSAIYWDWTPFYRLSLSTSGNGSLDTGSQWCESGTSLVVTATADPGNHLVSWLGDIGGAGTNDNPLFLTMDQARTLTAVFAADVGDVTVTIAPAQVNLEGAQWRMTSGPDTAWHTNGDVITNVPGAGGPYTITVTAVAGWTKPVDATNLWVIDGGLLNVPRTYMMGSMVLVPGGTFTMGIYQGAGGHPVTLSDFYMDTKPVTVGDYQAFCAATANPMPTAPPWGWGDTNLPIVNVTWNDASAYAAWAGKRLPTEAEYEYAMRSGAADQLYPWGNTINAGNANYNNTVGQPTAAGAYAANAYGLYDIAGNVWEWCEDWYQDVLTGPVTDPTGPGWGSYKVIRGGSYIKTSIALRNALRYYIEPSVGYVDSGFRCAANAGGMGGGGGGTPAGDVNGNGIPDWWEQYYFGLGGSGGSGSGGGFDAAGDPDQDGLNNAGEYAAGTDPTNPGSVLEMTRTETKPAENGFVIEWKSVGGKVYTVERCSNLLQGFVPVATNIAATPPRNTFTDTVPAVGPYFYRVRVK